MLCGGLSSKLGSSSGLGCTTTRRMIWLTATFVSALKQKKMESNAEPSFISSGYSNWKDVTVAFKKHQLSACHHKAVDVMITIPSTTKDIGEQLSQIHRQEKATNRRMFLKILSSIRYLARQGLALRGDGDEQDGNFLQLLKLKGDDPVMIDWLKRKANKYTSHQNPNDILRIMAVNVLREVAVCLQQSPFITLMMDETTGISNKEQSVIILRWVSEDFEVNEEFLGVYNVPTIDAATLTMAAKDALCRMNIPLSKLRGQCYDGASAMSGAKSGVAKRIQEEPRAVYTHCYGHSIILAICDAVKQSKPIKNALETTYEITKLIKHSPCREGIFKEKVQVMLLVIIIHLVCVCCVQQGGQYVQIRFLASYAIMHHFSKHGKKL